MPCGFPEASVMCVDILCAGSHGPEYFFFFLSFFFSCLTSVCFQITCTVWNSYFSFIRFLSPSYAVKGRTPELYALSSSSGALSDFRIVCSHADLHIRTSKYILAVTLRSDCGYVLDLTCYISLWTQKGRETQEIVFGRHLSHLGGFVLKPSILQGLLISSCSIVPNIHNNKVLSVIDYHLIKWEVEKTRATPSLATTGTAVRKMRRYSGTGCVTSSTLVPVDQAFTFFPVGEVRLAWSQVWHQFPSLIQTGPFVLVHF